MNAANIKSLLAGDKFMPEMHLKPSAFTYRDCGLFTKNKERTQKIKKAGDLKYIYQNELERACFQRDIYPEGQLLTKCYVKRNLQFIVIHSMMDISKNSPQWPKNFLTRNLETLLLTLEQELFLKINNWLMNYKNQLKNTK